jgi:hypothetical protein
MRVYATPADLADYAGPDVVGEDSPRLLARASELVDSLLVTAVYDTTPDGHPLDAHLREALRDATCALVQWWDETGDPTGAGAQYSDAAIGTLRLKRNDNRSAPDIAPAAVRILATAGLLAHAPLSPDHPRLLGER